MLHCTQYIIHQSLFVSSLQPISSHTQGSQRVFWQRHKTQIQYFIQEPSPPSGRWCDCLTFQKNIPDKRQGNEPIRGLSRCSLYRKGSIKWQRHLNNPFAHGGIASGLLVMRFQSMYFVSFSVCVFNWLLFLSLVFEISSFETGIANLKQCKTHFTLPVK